MIGGWSLLYRTIEDDITNLSRATNWMLERIQNSLSTPPTALSTYLEDITLDSTFYHHQAIQRRTRYTEVFNVLSYRVTAKQANSVSQLTMLAAFFLPLSLAAAVLSMQFRFADLHLVLYDFLGVVTIVGSIAALAYAITKYGPDFYNKIIVMNYGKGILESRKLLQALKVVCLAMWWLAMLTAFLVGMLKDPVLGLKIFGFEAAGITGVWVLSLKGVRVAHGYWRERKKKGVKGKKQPAWYPGANVSSW